MAKFLREGSDQSKYVRREERGGVTGYIFSYPEGYHFSRDPRTRSKSHVLDQWASEALRRSEDTSWEEGLRRHQTNAASRVPYQVLSQKELRTACREAGIPTSQKNGEMIEDLYQWAQGQPKNQTTSVGEFHNGRSLVVFTDDPIQRKALDQLVQAAQENHLRLGNADWPSSGVLFHDDRDISGATLAARDRERQWREQQLEKVDHLKKDFRENNITVFAISRPREGNDHDTDPSQIHYWLNASPRDHSQIMGWFTELELKLLSQGDYSPAN